MARHFVFCTLSDFPEIKKLVCYIISYESIEWISKMGADAPIPPVSMNSAAPEGTPPRRF